MAKAELRKEQEEGLLLDRLKELLVQISGQNTNNMTKLVDSLKAWKEETAAEIRLARVTKPAKVPTWTRDCTLETFIKTSQNLEQDQ